MWSWMMDGFHSSAFAMTILPLRFLQEIEVLKGRWLSLDFTMGKEPLIDEHDGTEWTCRMFWNYISDSSS